jgi:protein SCO1
VTEQTSIQRLKKVRLLLWLIIAIAILATAFIYLLDRPEQPSATTAQSSFGGPFTLTGADGRPFSSRALTGKPYAVYFGFTRCGDVCPTTLQRLVKLRREAGPEDKINILFVTIDPDNDGPKEVGQYAQLFGSPIIGLTGTPQQIEQVKKQYGIYAEPIPHAAMGQSIAHTATVLLFDREGKFIGTISKDEPDSSAVETLKRLTA